jgi:hypothetical protein
MLFAHYVGPVREAYPFPSFLSTQLACTRAESTVVINALSSCEEEAVGDQEGMDRVFAIAQVHMHCGENSQDPRRAASLYYSYCTEAEHAAQNLLLPTRLVPGRQLSRTRRTYTPCLTWQKQIGPEPRSAL